MKVESGGARDEEYNYTIYMVDDGVVVFVRNDSSLLFERAKAIEQCPSLIFDKKNVTNQTNETYSGDVNQTSEAQPAVNQP